MNSTETLFTIHAIQPRPLTRSTRLRFYVEDVDEKRYEEGGG